ncbi:probable serine/threonine-protein kinase PBL19 [Rhododendron vialii]|uniref:probable serine/threonine-protein kinase PBL19 n=1 Tax=Rhododendron vialii TaxID=182163 RepID=UPI00265EDF1D|nr:probable serine/threonine-protein kinase PBL19 [Rhododendron vialii]XP_058205024.1 probable serine/threonine-protein kinase PBL19 [Rhododendron vialii]XP_058205032.1 probable serine/threonine-protein kinase PBL19 [Rhododendron vialii]
MKCFTYFKDRTRSREQRSAPILEDPSKSETSAGGRETKSSCSATSHRSIPELYEEKSQNLRVFSFSELKQATNGFSRLLKIGEGGFGSVYKGSINPADGQGDSTVVAVKMLNRNSFQGHKQWVAEVHFLGVVEHPNLVKLIGYCAIDGERGIQRLLVYEFMPNKSLEDHLFNKAFPALSWERRVQIALGAAQGLTYLHEEIEVQVIYRDFKASNVLLDEDFKPKLSDFGLAREGPTAGHSHVSTAVVGTYGYAAPDYIETGHLTTKSDVWSFGVVLYEILTGRRSFERNLPKTEQKLLEWVKQYPADSKRFSMIMDPRLENQYSLVGARRIAKLADRCLVKSAKDRPMMSQVVESLKQIIRVSGEESPSSDKSLECNEHDSVNSDKKPEGGGPSESSKRRMAHLAKLSEHVGGINRRKFMILQSAKVP